MLALEQRPKSSQRVSDVVSGGRAVQTEAQSVQRSGAVCLTRWRSRGNPCGPGGGVDVGVQCRRSQSKGWKEGHMWGSVFILRETRKS